MSPIREPAFAGRFYPSDPFTCRALVDKLFEMESEPTSMAGIVPHAGWMYSGGTAALTIRSIAAYKPETVIIFGAVHILDRHLASLFDRGIWRTPIGESQIDCELCAELLKSSLISASPESHLNEHSIEVELPLIQRLLPDVKLVPLMVNPSERAADVGRVAAAAAESLGRRVAYLASTDLTHYGPAFGFEPMGSGEPGIRWAKEVNDRRFLAVVGSMDPEAIVPEADHNRNACGSGAVAALLGAIADKSKQSKELCHTCSAEVKPELRPENSVGYASTVFI